MKQRIEIEIAFEHREEAEKLANKLLNGENWMGLKHGKWVLFITCSPAEILHLGQELHYELNFEDG